MTQTTCKTCRWFGAPRPARIEMDQVYPCAAPFPDLNAILPISITRGFVWPEKLPTKSKVSPRATNCPAHEPIKKEPSHGNG